MGTSLVIQCLKFSTLTARTPSLIPGRGTKIPQAAWHSQKKRWGTKIIANKKAGCENIYTELPVFFFI